MSDLVAVGPSSIEPINDQDPNIDKREGKLKSKRKKNLQDASLSANESKIIYHA